MIRRRITILFISVLLLTFCIVPVVSAGAEAATSSGYSKTITINPGQVASPQNDFPLLIQIKDDSDLQSHVARADGGDIYFTDSSNTTRYPYEVEKYDKFSGTLTAWVKVPALTDGTVITLHYGLDSGSPLWNVQQVWDSHFKMVQHMDEKFSTAVPQIQDSTLNHNLGAYKGKPAPAAGKIGAAIGFSGASYIDCGADSSLNFKADGAYTWEAWINPKNFMQGGSGIVGKKQTPNVDFQGYEISLGGTGGGGGSGPGQFRFQTSGGNAAELGASRFYMPLNAWTQVMVTYAPGSQISLYINGALNNSGTLKVLDDTTSSLYIGWRRSAPSGAANGFFAGSIDEVRLSDTIRSADWILTGYRNQSAPEKFYTISSETGGRTQDRAEPAAIAGESRFTLSTADFKSLIDPSTGKTRRAFSFWSDDGKAALEIAVNTLARDAEGQPLTQLSCRPAAVMPADSAEYKVIADYTYGPQGATFNLPVTIKIKYADSAIPAGVARGDLALAYRDAGDFSWVKLSGITVNTLEQTVSGQVGRLTQFALLAPAAASPTADAEDEGGLGSGGGPNWWLISINIVIVLAALAYLFIYRPIRSKNKKT